MRLSGTILCTFHWSHTSCLCLPTVVYWGCSYTANGIGLGMPGTRGDISWPDHRLWWKEHLHPVAGPVQRLSCHQEQRATGPSCKYSEACVTALLFGLSSNWNVIKKSVLSLGHICFSVHSEKTPLWWHTAACIHLHLWLAQGQTQPGLKAPHIPVGRRVEERGHWETGPFVPLPAPCQAAASSLIHLHTSAWVEDQPRPKGRLFPSCFLGVLCDRTQNLWDWRWRWYFMCHLAKLLIIQPCLYPVLTRNFQFLDSLHGPSCKFSGTE